MMKSSSTLVTACAAIVTVVLGTAIAKVDRQESSALGSRPDGGLIQTNRGAEDLSDLVIGTFNPEDIEEPVPYDIIVVGIPTAILGTVNEPTATPPPGGWPDSEVATSVAEAFSSELTEYLISVETVILDDGLISSEEDLIVQTYGEHPTNSSLATADAASNYPMDELGQRYMYFLQESINFPGKYIVVRGMEGRLRMTGSVVTYSDGARSPVSFATGTAPSQFYVAVATAVANQYPPTPTP